MGLGKRLTWKTTSCPGKERMRAFSRVFNWWQVDVFTPCSTVQALHWVCTPIEDTDNTSQHLSHGKRRFANSFGALQITRMKRTCDDGSDDDLSMGHPKQCSWSSLSGRAALQSVSRREIHMYCTQYIRSLKELHVSTETSHVLGLYWGWNALARCVGWQGC